MSSNKSDKWFDAMKEEFMSVEQNNKIMSGSSLNCQKVINESGTNGSSRSKMTQIAILNDTKLDLSPRAILKWMELTTKRFFYLSQRKTH